MPQYQFHCNSCHKDVTITKKMTEYTPNEPCPECSTIMTRKVEDMVCDYVNKCGGFYGRKSN